MTNPVLQKHLIQNHTNAKKTLRDFQSQGGLHTSDVSFFFFLNLLSLNQWRHGYFGLNLFQARGHFFILGPDMESETITTRWQ